MHGCTPYIHALLDVISELMLRVDPDHRASAEKLLKRLEEIHGRGSTEPGYLTDSVPERRDLGPNHKDERVADDLNPQIIEAWKGAMKAAANALKVMENGSESGNSVHEPTPKQGKTVQASGAVEADTGSGFAHELVAGQPKAAKQSLLRMWLLFFFWEAVGWFSR